MLLVFDGDCGFCARSARWIRRRLPESAAAEPWQALDLAGLGLTAVDVAEAAWWFSPDLPRPVRGHEAIGRALAASGGARAVAGRLIAARPGAWISRPVYAAVSRNRRRTPGGACRA